MTNPPDLDALRYLLDDLDAEARSVFEQRLAHDPALQRTLRQTREALTHFATEAAPPESLPAADQRRVLAHVMAAMDHEPRRHPRAALRRWAWPLAACILLALNLWQFTRPEAADGDRIARAQSAPGAPASVAERRNETDPAADAEAEAREGANAGATAVAAETPVTIGLDELRRLREIRLEYERLAADNDRLRAEHTEILRQLAAYALTERGVNRLAAMELVDPESYAAGQRKGLLDFALNLLTEPGIIALEPEAAAAGNEVPNGNGDPATPGPGDDVDAANEPPGPDDDSTSDDNAPFSHCSSDDS